MLRRLFFLVLIFFPVAAASPAQTLAPTPPMGWNSWDAYGFTIDEVGYMENVLALASLKQYGWQYAVIDEGWYMQNPLGDKLETRKYVLNANGLLIPDKNRFTSAANGAGFRPLSTFVHGKGLKFGIHIVRGIPKQAVRDNLPIEGSSFHAADAADTTDLCPWDDGNYGVRDTPAGQAYYDSMMRLYASWGVDYVKVDCIAAHPYLPQEIRMISDAIKKTGRAMVLSLSPGPAPIERGDEISGLAQMWRISDDHWDGWTFPHTPGSDFPSGVLQAFGKLGEWQTYAKPGSWPDADMLPWGELRPHPGWGEPRHTRLTEEEQKTEFTLWAIARSPLIVGANLTMLDDYSKSLMTNKDLISLNQNARIALQVDLPREFNPVRVWESQIDFQNHSRTYFAFFNLGDKPMTVHATWAQLGFPGKHTARNIWDGSKMKPADSIEITLAAHASALYEAMY
jgi:hypothetical protein